MIHLSNITKQHGSQTLFRAAGFQILPGSRNGLVGPNGAGKTTIFRIITGEEEADGGEMRVYEGDYRYYLEKTRDEATTAV